MLVDNFRENCAKYHNFAVWDVADMRAFFEGNATLAEIFKIDYKMSVGEFEERRKEISDTNMQIMRQLLDQIGDKEFYIFTYHDDNHWELVQMQNLKIMNFGMDIEQIAEDHVYILLMDKKPELNMLSNWAPHAKGSTK